GGRRSFSDQAAAPLGADVDIREHSEAGPTRPERARGTSAGSAAPAPDAPPAWAERDRGCDASDATRHAPSPRARLDRIRAAGLVERGSVFVLSLEPIREQSGEKWSARKEQIWERTERALAAKLPVEDVYLRADDVSFVVAVASCSTYEGQVRCVSVLREIMAHFLGRHGDDDIQLSRVTSVSGDDLVGEAVDVAATPAPRHDSASAAPAPTSGAVAPGRWNPPLAGRSYAAPFTNLRGVAVEMELQIVPVWCLRRGVVSSYAIRRAYPYLQQPTSDFDQEAADVQTVLRMAGILQEYRRCGGAFALHVPIHFSTAASRRSRVNLLGLCAEVLPLMRQAVIFEIENVDGVPFGRLQEAVSMCSPFAREVTVGVREGERLNPFIRDCGLSGISITAGAASTTMSSLRYLIARSRRMTPNMVVHNLDPTSRIEPQLPGL